MQHPQSVVMSMNVGGEVGKGGSDVHHLVSRVKVLNLSFLTFLVSWTPLAVW